MKKFAVVSPLLPPTRSGQPLVLYNLLKNCAPSDYCLISEADYSGVINGSDSGCQLEGRYYSLKLFLKSYYLNRLIERYLLKLNFILPHTFFENLIKKRSKSIERILKSENCKVVVACTGSIFDPIAAYYASRNLGIEFIFYIFDLYSCQFTFPEGIAFTEKYEEILIKNAEKVILTNEFVYDEYLKKYDVKGYIIHNPVPYEPEVEQLIVETGNLNGKTMEILYAGSIYAAHYDAFKNLVRAIDKIQNFRLRLITSQRKFILKIKGIKGSFIFFDKLKSQSEIFELQKKADILFFPLAFNSPYPRLIRNSSPGKMGEYLASGKPVLVHAPSDSFLSWYFKEKNCGIVADKNDHEFLAEKLMEVTGNDSILEEIVKNAMNCAKKDFSPEESCKKFEEIVGS
jgi:glycosyltransferase involved in cell wall biosynthesis